jgi:hypothetical protein
MIKIKKYLSSLRGRVDLIKRREAVLQQNRAYRYTRWLVLAIFGLLFFFLKLFAVIVWSSAFGEGSKRPYGRGYAGVVTREEMEDTQGPIPAYYDDDNNQFMGPNVRH